MFRLRYHGTALETGKIQLFVVKPVFGEECRFLSRSRVAC